MVANSTTQMPFGGTAHGCAACRQLHADIKVSVTQITDKLDKLFIRVEELFAQKENGVRCLPSTATHVNDSPVLPMTATSSIRPTNSLGKIGVATKKEKEAKKLPEMSINSDENGLIENYNSRYERFRVGKMDKNRSIYVFFMTFSFGFPTFLVFFDF